MPMIIIEVFICNLIVAIDKLNFNMSNQKQGSNIVWYVQMPFWQLPHCLLNNQHAQYTHRY